MKFESLTYKDKTAIYKFYQNCKINTHIFQTKVKETFLMLRVFKNTK